MRLDLTETFAGVPARRVRDVLRRAGSRWVTPYWLAQATGTSDDQADNLVDTLVSRGLIERDEDEDVVKLTEQGIAFSQASLNTVTRKTADRLLHEFLDRVRALNADEDALYQVPEVVVFGSYLTNAERLGDVDLAIEPVQVRMARDDEVLSARPTWQHLRNRSRTLSMIELELHREWLSDKPHMVILDDPEVAARGKAYQRAREERWRRR
jgi:predicted transcriptional regulator